jgi:hypothetical protein
MICAGQHGSVRNRLPPGKSDLPVANALIGAEPFRQKAAWIQA